MRDKKIDFLKGFAIILVVLGHVVQYGHPNYNENIVYKLIYSFHMPLFMFLSGWVMNYSLKKDFVLSVFMKKRFIQLMVPFITWAILGSLYRSLSSKTIIDISSFIHSFTAHFLRPEHGLWYCWVLFFACMIHGIIYRLTKNGGTGVLIVVALVLLVLPLPNIFGLHNLQKLLVFYTAGYVINKNKYSSSTTCNVIGAVLWSISVFIVFIRGHRFIFDENLIVARYEFLLINRLVLTLIAGTWIYVLFVVAKRIKQTDHIEMLGRYSMDLYVLQGFPTVLVTKMQHLIASSIIMDVVFTLVYAGILIMGLFFFSKYVIRKNKHLSLLLLGSRR